MRELYVRNRYCLNKALAALLFNEIEFMLKNKNCQWGKKTCFRLSLFFSLHFFFTNSLHVGTFPRKRHLYHFFNLSKNLKMFALF